MTVAKAIIEDKTMFYENEGWLVQRSSTEPLLTVNLISEVVCRFKNRCGSYPNQCGTCMENKNRRQDYYKPVKQDYYIKIVPDCGRDRVLCNPNATPPCPPPKEDTEIL